MLFRRIKAHIEKENWFAVFIDFLIVVVGILIAFQITEWNEQRQKRVQTDRLFERLEATIGLDAWLADGFLSYYQEVIKNGKLAIDDLDGRQSLSDKELLITAFRATQFSRLLPTNSIYEELISTGGFDLVGDSALGQVARLLYESGIADEIMVTGQNSEYRRLFRTIVPIDVQLALVEACGDRYRSLDEMMAGRSLISYECTFDLPIAEITNAAAILRENSKLTEALQHRLAELSQQILDFVPIHKAVAPFRASRSELKKTSTQISVFMLDSE